MKKLFLAVCAGMLLAAVAVAQDVNAPIHQLLDGFNNNDTKAVAASYASGDVVIVDEVAPFHWSGPHANDDWGADLDKHDKAAGITDDKVNYSAATRTDVVGDSAYVVVPVVYVYKEKGKPMLEEAHMTFALHRENGAWKIAGWVWTGSKPHAAK